MIPLLLRVIEQTLLYLPMVCGSYISLSLMKVPDLSLESSFVFGAITATTALTLSQQLPMIAIIGIVLCASILGGMLVGIVSSCMVQYGNIPPLLASILTIGLFHGISLTTLQGTYRSINNLPNPLAAAPFIHGKPEMIMLALISFAIAIFLYYLFKTQLGFALCIYGNNPNFFSYFHQSTSYVYITGIAIANACAGISGYLFAQTNGFVEVNMGFGIVLLCITALILGKTIVHSSHAIITLPIAGLFSYTLLQQLLLRAGITSAYFTMIQAAIVLVLVLYNYRHTPLNGQQLGV
jgi:putative ABC transport system permease protein